MPEIFVAKAAELPDGERRIVEHGGLEIGVFCWEGKFYAYQNLCVHQGGPACEGIVRSKVVDLYAADKSFLGQTYDNEEPHIVCPWHGWEYKLLTGECAPDPTLRLKKHEIVQRDGGVYVVI